MHIHVDEQTPLGPYKACGCHHAPVAPPQGAHLSFSPKLWVLGVIMSLSMNHQVPSARLGRRRLELCQEKEKSLVVL